MLLQQIWWTCRTTTQFQKAQSKDHSKTKETAVNKEGSCCSPKRQLMQEGLSHKILIASSKHLVSLRDYIVSQFILKIRISVNKPDYNSGNLPVNLTSAMNLTGGLRQASFSQSHTYNMGMLTAFTGFYGNITMSLILWPRSIALLSLAASKFWHWNSKYDLEVCSRKGRIREGWAPSSISRKCLCPNGNRIQNPIRCIYSILNANSCCENVE